MTMYIIHSVVGIEARRKMANSIVVLESHKIFVKRFKIIISYTNAFEIGAIVGILIASNEFK